MNIVDSFSELNFGGFCLKIFFYGVFFGVDGRILLDFEGFNI